MHTALSRASSRPANNRRSGSLSRCNAACCEAGLAVYATPDGHVTSASRYWTVACIITACKHSNQSKVSRAPIHVKRTQGTASPDVAPCLMLPKPTNKTRRYNAVPSSSLSCPQHRRPPPGTSCVPTLPMPCHRRRASSISAGPPTPCPGAAQSLDTPPASSPTSAAACTITSDSAANTAEVRGPSCNRARLEGRHTVKHA